MKKQRGLKEALDQVATPERIAGKIEDKYIQRRTGLINFSKFYEDNQGNEMENITVRPSFFIRQPKYSKDFLKRMNEAAGAIGKVFESRLKQQGELEVLRRKNYITEADQERIIKLQDAQHFF